MRQGNPLIEGVGNYLIVAGPELGNSVIVSTRLAGEVDQTTVSRSRGAGGNSWSTGLRRIPVLGVEDLRSLPAGHAVLFYRHLRPAAIRLAPRWQLPIAPAVLKSQKAIKALT